MQIFLLLEILKYNSSSKVLALNIHEYLDMMIISVAFNSLLNSEIWELDESCPKRHEIWKVWQMETDLTFHLETDFTFHFHSPWYRTGACFSIFFSSYFGNKTGIIKQQTICNLLNLENVFARGNTSEDKHLVSPRGTQ